MRTRAIVGVVLVGVVFIAGSTAVSAQRQRRPEVVFEGTALENQPDLIRCGDMAIGGWVTFRVDRVIRGPVPRGVVRLVMGCPRTGSYGMYILMNGIPDDAVPTFWERRWRPLVPARP
jgi:hypothetical protein